MGSAVEYDDREGLHENPLAPIYTPSTMVGITHCVWKCNEHLGIHTICYV